MVQGRPKASPISHSGQAYSLMILIEFFKQDNVARRAEQLLSRGKSMKIGGSKRKARRHAAGLKRTIFRRSYCLPEALASGLASAFFSPFFFFPFFLYSLTELLIVLI